MKIALVHDDLIQHGGSERLFSALVEIWPTADIYTSMATQEYRRLFQQRVLRESFMRRLPFKERLYRSFFPLYPLAFETFDFSGYDLVISSSARFAHGIITRPETKHFCYLHSPGRMLWEPNAYFQDRFALQLLTAPLLARLRCWDYAAAQRVDYFIANSRSVQKKIKKYYGREAEVIYPFVELERFREKKGSVEKSVASRAESYFLVVSRLTAWKRIDIAIEACNRLGLPLAIVGSGPDEVRLRKMAGPTVEFWGRLSDAEVVECLKNSRALIFPQEEDFGMVPLEAMAAGKPVLAFRGGGALETVLPRRTGEFFYPQSVGALVEILRDFSTESYDPGECRKQARRFSREIFSRRIKEFVETRLR